MRQAGLSKFRATVAGNPARELSSGAAPQSGKVPFMDLKAQYATIRPDISRAMQQVLDNTAYVGGPDIGAFEREFATYIGTSRSAAVGSGTAALQFALRAMGVGPGDEVVTHPNTFIATVGAIALTGARPVFVDIEANGIWPTVDSFLAAQVPDAASRRICLKMDTQGYDLEVFRGLGACTADVHALQSELSVVPIYNGMPHWTESILEFEKAGFGVAGMFPVNRDSLKVIEYDCLFVKSGNSPEF